MKEVNAAREAYWASKLKIEEQRAYLEDRFIYGTGGERNTEKKTVSLQRDKLSHTLYLLWRWIQHPSHCGSGGTVDCNILRTFYEAIDFRG